MVIVNAKMISKKLLNPVNLFKIQTFYIYEVIIIVMIHKKKHFLLAIFRIVVQYFKDFNNN